MKTATKHTTIVSSVVRKMQDVETRILAETGMTAEELFEMKLTIGLQFIEVFSKMFISDRVSISNNLAENPDWNFWNWWNLHWVRDDAMLLQTQLSGVRLFYDFQKEAMVGNDLLTKDLYWMIQQYTDKL